MLRVVLVSGTRRGLANEGGDAAVARTIAAGSKTCVYGCAAELSGRHNATLAPKRSSIVGIDSAPSTSTRDHSRQNGAPAGSTARMGRPIERGSVRPLTLM